MFSRSGISWRHGPHQLAQKFIITTCPLYWLRLTVLPPRAGRLNVGAGPGAPASAGTAMRSAAMPRTVMRVNDCLIPTPYQMSPSEKDGRTDVRLEIAGELVDAEQIRVVHPILHGHVHGNPVSRQDAVAGT